MSAGSDVSFFIVSFHAVKLAIPFISHNGYTNEVMLMTHNNDNAVVLCTSGLYMGNSMSGEKLYQSACRTQPNQIRYRHELNFCKFE